MKVLPFVMVIVLMSAMTIETALASGKPLDNVSWDFSDGKRVWYKVQENGLFTPLGNEIQSDEQSYMPPVSHIPVKSSALKGCTKLKDGDVLSGNYTLCPGNHSLKIGIIITGPTVIEGNNNAAIVGPGSIAYNYTQPIGVFIASSEVTVKNVVFRGWGTAIGGTLSNRPASNIRILHNTFNGNYYSISLVNADHSIVQENVIKNTFLGIRLTSYLKDLGFNMIKNNDLEIGKVPEQDPAAFAEGITLYNSISNDQAYRFINNGIIQNEIRYAGCTDAVYTCSAPGIYEFRTRNTIIQGNTLSNVIGGNGITFSGNVGHKILNNRIEGVSTNFFYTGGGIASSNFANDPATLTIIRNNRIQGTGPSSYGFINVNIFGNVRGGLLVERNSFEGMEYGLFSQFIKEGIVKVLKNNFIRNMHQIDNSNANDHLIVFENHFSDHTGIGDCNPSPDGYCKNPYTWNGFINQDNRTKRMPYPPAVRI